MDGLEPTRAEAFAFGDGGQAQGGKFALLGVAQLVVDMIVYRRDGGHALEDDPTIQRLDIRTLERLRCRQTILEDQQLALDWGPRQP